MVCPTHILDEKGGSFEPLLRMPLQAILLHSYTTGCIHTNLHWNLVGASVHWGKGTGMVELYVVTMNLVMDIAIVTVVLSRAGLNRFTAPPKSCKHLALSSHLRLLCDRGV